MKNVRSLRKEDGENCGSGEFMFISDIRSGLSVHAIVIFVFFFRQTYVMGGSFIFISLNFFTWRQGQCN